MKTERLDYKVIYQTIEKEAKVLDLGCGDGELLSFLVHGKKAKVQGIELSNEAIYKCVEKGLSVFNGDIESGLSGYPDKAFDYVILNQSMQEVKKVDYVMEEALRVGKKAIVGFSNFAYIAARMRIFFKGKTPITSSLPHRWHSTPNVHFLSISDFLDFCTEKNLTIINSYYLGRKRLIKMLPNLFALNAVFVITKKDFHA